MGLCGNRCCFLPSCSPSSSAKTERFSASGSASVRNYQTFTENAQIGSFFAPFFFCFFCGFALYEGNKFVDLQHKESNLSPKELLFE